MARVRVALCGTGYWARTVWAPTLAAADAVDLVGVWGRDATKSGQLASELGISDCGSVPELIESADVVAVCLPPDVQPEIASAAARAGRHLLLEKPLALDVASADRVAADVEHHGVASVVLFTGRFLPEFAAWVESSAVAKATGGHAVWLGAPFSEGSPFHASTWRREHGALWDVGPHLLSAFVPVLGPIDSSDGAVTASRGPGDTVHVALRHEGGASSVLTTSFTVEPPATHLEAAFWGPSGWMPMPQTGWDASLALAGAIDEVVAAAHGDSPSGQDPTTTLPACDAAFARDVVAVLDRIQRALPPVSSPVAGGDDGKVSP
jgi:predicted dehydrogenase